MSEEFCERPHLFNQTNSALYQALLQTPVNGKAVRHYLNGEKLPSFNNRVKSYCWTRGLKFHYRSAAEAGWVICWAENPNSRGESSAEGER